MQKLLIIGGGNMGYAIASGIIKNKIIPKSNIVFIENKPERINFLKKNKFTLQVGNLNKTNYSAIILAVKPTDISNAIKEIKPIINKNQLIISIAAGIKIQTISSLTSKAQPIVRIMPNTPCQIGSGISAITYSKNITNAQKNFVRKIFNSLGKIIELDEAKFDLVTALSGSGPAYFCYFIEALADSAYKLGLQKTISNELVLQTALGTLMLLANGSLSPKLLREMVTSPKGTTEAALKTFDRLQLNTTIYKALKAARDRAIELGLLASCFLILASCFLPLASLAVDIQDPIQLSTKKEDISLTDDLVIARAQVAKYPENPEAHFNLAIALSRTSLVEEAIKELRRTKLLLRKEENKELIDKKIVEYKEIINSNLDSETVNNVRYRLAFSHYLKAYLINKALEKKEEKSGKSSSKTNLLSSKKLISLSNDPSIAANLNLSVYYFKDLLRINPNDPWTKIYYAFILAEQFNEIDNAKKLWLEVVKESPNNPAPHFFLGELHIKQGDLNEGIKEISQAILLRSLGN